MKTILLLIGCFVAISFVSCKKSYTCTCSGTNSTSSFTETYDLGKIKKKDAESKCNTVGANWVAQGGTCVATEN